MTNKGALAVAEMKRHLGSWYLWGGTGPTRFDCSGLGFAAYRKAGVTIPRNTYGQINGGWTVHRGGLKPGDAILLHPSRPGVPEHVIWCVDESKDLAIHAPHTGAKVTYCSIKAKVAALGLVGCRRYATWTNPPKYNLRRKLKLGSKGEDVRRLRKHLGMKTTGAGSNSFGPKTVLNVYKDRRRHGLPGKPRIVDAAYAHKLGWLFNGK